MGDGLQIANALSDSGGVPKAGLRYSIHDVIIDDLNAAKYAGNGTFAQVSMDKGVPVLQDVTINHVTAFPSNAMLVLGDDIKVNPPMKNFVFTNNIVNGPYPVLTTGGGPVNCAYYNTPLIALGACFEPYTFSHNAVVATRTNFPLPANFPLRISFRLLPQASISSTTTAATAGTTICRALVRTRMQEWMARIWEPM